MLISTASSSRNCTEASAMTPIPSPAQPDPGRQLLPLGQPPGRWQRHHHLQRLENTALTGNDQEIFRLSATVDDNAVYSSSTLINPRLHRQTIHPSSLTPILPCSSPRSPGIPPAIPPTALLMPPWPHALLFNSTLALIPLIATHQCSLVTPQVMDAYPHWMPLKSCGALLDCQQTPFH